MTTNLKENVSQAAYYSLLAAEREQRWWLQLFLAGTLAALALTVVGAFTVVWHARNPTLLFARDGLVSDEPPPAHRCFVAWEAAQGLLSTNSATVEEDLERSKRWMTDTAVQDLDRAMAAYERSNKSSYVADIRAQGVGTDFESVEAVCEPVVGSGADKRYPVLIKGTKTVLTSRNAPVSTRPFAIRVYLVRVPIDEGNPSGLLAHSFSRTPTDTPGAVNDVPAVVAGEPPAASDAKENPQ